MGVPHLAGLPSTLLRQTMVPVFAGGGADVAATGFGGGGAGCGVGEQAVITASMARAIRVARRFIKLSRPVELAAYSGGERLGKQASAR